MNNDRLKNNIRNVASKSVLFKESEILPFKKYVAMLPLNSMFMYNVFYSQDRFFLKSAYRKNYLIHLNSDFVDEGSSFKWVTTPYDERQDS